VWSAAANGWTNLNEIAYIDNNSDVLQNSDVVVLEYMSGASQLSLLGLDITSFQTINISIDELYLPEICTSAFFGETRERVRLATPRGPNGRRQFAPLQRARLLHRHEAQASDLPISHQGGVAAQGGMDARDRAGPGDVRGTAVHLCRSCTGKNLDRGFI